MVSVSTHVRTDSTNYNTQVYVLIYTRKKMTLAQNQPYLDVFLIYKHILSVTCHLLHPAVLQLTRKQQSDDEQLHACKTKLLQNGCGQRGVVNGTMMNIQTAPRRPLWPANAFDYTQFTFIADLTRS